nr:DUF5336 domain-containing protein [Mycolicibacterium komanii]CRL74566.1 hypothetical protein CPGR_03723 [Mycolicibacterium komanii]
MSRARTLFIAVAVLGLIVYGVGFAGEAAQWSVRFAAAAGVVAGVGLLSKTSAMPVAALAVLGFLDALRAVLADGQSDWFALVILALTALQGIAAVAALVTETDNASQAAPAGYEAYVDYYNQAVRNYYSHQAQPAAEQTQRSGYGQAYGVGQASAQGQRTQQASQYADYRELGYATPPAPSPQSVDGAADHPPGMPNVGQAAASADRYRPQVDESEPPPPAG